MSLDVETIEQLQTQLATHRRRLAYRLRQQARLGDHASPEVAFDIEDAQVAIRDLKTQLRAAGIAVTDDPSDIADVSVALIAAPTQLEDRNRRRMLQKVRDFWIRDVLEHSLQGAPPIALRLEAHAEAVARPWEQAVPPDETPRALPPGTSIVDVFDAQSGELLILGAPGAGKTTLLLMLARELLDRADRDAGHPIPVIFNLSSWAERRLSLAAWMVDELNKQHDVPRVVAQTWIEGDQVLPLLDGLDEVRFEQRDDCVMAINAFRQQHGLVSMVASSRITDYEALGIRLKLQSAVLVQPLSADQIDAYLASAGEQFGGLRQALTEDSTLRELTESPLMLSIIALAGPGGPVTASRTTTSLEERRRQLFDDYVSHMFRRRGTGRRYSREQTQHGLARLARNMHQNGQKVFLIEHMQPQSWLTPAQLRLYTAVVGLLVGLPLAVGYGFGAFQLYRFMPVYGIAGGRFLGLMYGLVFGSVFGLVFALVARGNVRRFGVARGVLRYVPTAIGVGVLVGAGATVLTVLVEGLDMRFLIGRSFTGLFSGLMAGILAGLFPHPEQIAIVETFRWSWVGALAGVRRRWVTGLLAGLVLGLASAIPLSLNDTPAAGWQAGIVFGIIGALIALLIVGLNAGLTTGEIEVRSGANQGVWRSARHGALLGAIAALLVGTTVGLAAWLIIVTTNERGLFQSLALSDIGPAIGSIFGIGLGLAVALLYGGLACSQHIALRFVLWRIGALPLNLVGFLDACADRILLRKVGGGYIFIHQLLLEYFATLEQVRSSSPALEEGETSQNS
jgi:DNA polymerase III delta prime subunit